MALVAKALVSFEVQDGPIGNFKSGKVESTSTNFTHSFGADIIVPGETSDLGISLQNVNRAHQVFIWSDSEVEVKLVPYGKTLADVQAFKLIAKAPSLLSVQNIVEIAVSNPGNMDARVIIEGAGLNIA